MARWASLFHESSDDSERLGITTSPSMLISSVGIVDTPSFGVSRTLSSLGAFKRPRSPDMEVTGLLPGPERVKRPRAEPLFFLNNIEYLIWKVWQCFILLLLSGLIQSSRCFCLP